ncbi:hypothetical protein [Sessilibacter corallicola]|uniref:hypothetical protein n=1 Tax=Sessilibacter corallicola TaxID=2904075 RepID=UPI001E395247|nr:hypothetical protein [Sessilibacter corallicola]MCE2029531.1 hypothetical protein [Sessilibacter corallicola]
MISLVKTLKCPHCSVPISRELLQKSGTFKDFINRKPFPCPHCQESTQLPEGAETAVSAGIFVAVILAPLFHLWEVNGINPLYVFGAGCALVVFGMSSQKLIKVTSG